jgi:hypothetical protein
MNRVILSSLLVAMLGISSAYAGEYSYVTPTFDAKDKVDSTSNHEVFGLNVGHNYGNGWNVEALMENERVNGGAHEGLMQLKVDKDIGTWYGVTPYAGVAVGMKDKSTSDFFYYVGEVGAKYKITPRLSAFVQERLRTPFNENLDGHTGYGYKTWETSIGAKYAITPTQAVGVRYAVERGDSSYDTVGVNYTYSF